MIEIKLLIMLLTKMLGPVFIGFGVVILIQFSVYQVTGFSIYNNFSKLVLKELK